MSANKRVGFIQSLLADPEKKKALMVSTIIATQAREGIKTTREQAEAAYAKSQSRPNSSRIAASSVSSERRPASPPTTVQHTQRSLPSTGSGESRGQEATAIRRGVNQSVVADSEERLERIQHITGTLRAYDGRYCVWGTNGSFDVRDIGNRIGLTTHDVVEALPDFTPVKRGRASVTPEGEDND